MDYDKKNESIIELFKILNKDINQYNNNIEVKNLNTNKLKNKLWNCFLFNDGSMTKMLNILYDIEINLISNNVINIEDNSNLEILKLIESLCDFKLNVKDKKVVERNVSFISKNDNKVIMKAFSFGIIILFH